MKKYIVLKSFSALSFDVIVRQTPVRAMHSPPPTPKHRLAVSAYGDMPVEDWSPVDSAKADRTETAGHFPNCNQRVVNGNDRAAWPTSTSSVR